MRVGWDRRDGRDGRGQCCVVRGTGWLGSSWSDGRDGWGGWDGRDGRVVGTLFLADVKVVEHVIVSNACPAVTVSAGRGQLERNSGSAW